MFKSVRLSFTVIAVLTIIIGAGWLLWQQRDPRLEDVELVTVAANEIVPMVEVEDVAPIEDPALVTTAVMTSDEKVPTEIVTNDPVVTEAVAVASPTETVTVVAEPETEAEPVSTVRVSVLGPNLQLTCDVPVTETTAVHKVMLAASTQCGFSYDGQKQGNLGFFVEEIGGLKQSIKNGQYWVFSVNGEKSQLGVSAREVQPKDSIVWTYEAEY